MAKKKNRVVVLSVDAMVYEDVKYLRTKPNFSLLYDGGSFLYSHHATDPCCGRLVNAFDLVRIHRFGGLDEGSGEQDTTRLPSYRAMLDWAASDPVVKRRMADERIARVMADFGDLTVSEEGDSGSVKDSVKENPNASSLINR